MMKTSFKKKSVLRLVRKAKPSAPRIARADARLLDAEQFLLPTYKRQPVVMTHGRGAYVFDSTGKKYLDFLGGIAVNALGHAHPRVVKVIRREAARAIHLSNLFHNAYQGPLARKLAAWSGMDRVFFSNSGTEAVDGAMKRWRILFMAAPSAPSALPPRENIGCPSRPWFPAPNLFALTTSLILRPNLTIRFAPFLSKLFREKAAFTPSAKLSGIALAHSLRSTALS
jgi:hypothetical protein